MILEDIVGNRKRLLEKEKQALSLERIRQDAEHKSGSGYRPVDFLYAFNADLPFLIAEIKKASPSKGVIRENFDVSLIAAAYGSSEAVNAISVLTEPDYFSGKYEYIGIAKEASGKPVLMKDFVVDEYQVYRAFLEGASAVLLIAAVLTDSEIKKLNGIASALNLKVLFEVHTVSEYKRALDLGFELIGINNRDLKTFTVDVNNTLKIIESEGRPENRTIISESGISSAEGVRALFNNGVNGFLIGESFMKQDNINGAITGLFGDYYE